jgi:hypothetical protein
MKLRPLSLLISVFSASLWFIFLSASPLLAFEVKGKEFVQTAEDKRLLEGYRALYERNRNSLQGGRIPKVAHFIWLGPKEFPVASVANVKRFIDLHPGWTVKFWTDGKQLPDLRMKKEAIEEFDFQTLGKCFDKSDNFGEKSHLLRYEILLQEGGVYLDHDVEVKETLDFVSTRYDFYAGLETPAPSLLSTSIVPTTHLLAAMPSHPIFAKTVDWIEEHWDKVGLSFPGNNPDILLARVKQRVVIGLSEGIQAHWENGSVKNLVVPSLEKIAHHAHAMSWLDTTTEFERKMEGELTTMKKETTRALYLLIGLAAIQLSAAGLIFLKARRAT